MNDHQYLWRSLSRFGPDERRDSLEAKEAGAATEQIRSLAAMSDLKFSN